MSTISHSAAADFVERFREFWNSPDPERLDSLLSPDVVLVSPMMPTTTTLSDAKAEWAKLRGLIPDLRNEVHRWGASEDGVFIEFTLSGTVGDDVMSWDVVDRFIVGEDGLAKERVAYYDPSPLAAAFAHKA